MLLTIVLDKRNTTELTKNSNQERVQQEIQNLSLKKRKERTSKERVRLLQLKLYLKAKQEKGYKFYILYDKIFQKHVLEQAYKRSKSKDGSAPVTLP